MKRLLVLTILVAVFTTALVGATSASANSNIHVFGWALEYSGGRCGSDCTAFMQVNDHNGGQRFLVSGTVSNGSNQSCWGSSFPYNFGNPGAGPYPPCPIFNPGFDYNLGSGWVDHVYDVYSWIRHGCPAGFYYSPTHSTTVNAFGINRDYNWYAGTLRLQTPMQCYPAMITDAGLKTALVG